QKSTLAAPILSFPRIGGDPTTAVFLSPGLRVLNMKLSGKPLTISVLELLLFLSLAAMATAQSATIAVVTASPGPVSASPALFTPTAVDRAGYPITGFVVYVDGVNVYRNYSSTLATWVILPFGTHNVFVRAWDSQGNFGSSPTIPLVVEGAIIP